MILSGLGQGLGNSCGSPDLVMPPIRQGRQGAPLGLDTLVGLAGHDGQDGDLSLGEWLIAHGWIVAWVGKK